MIVHEVPVGVAREELSRYLRRAWPLLPGHVLRDLLKRRDVRVNGARSGQGVQICGGDRLEIYGAQRFFEPEAQVIFDDGHLMAAIKPQGLPSVPDRDGVGADTMEARMRRRHPQAQLCHRLDTATGGVLLAALDEETYLRAFEAFKQHALRKRYRALLCGCPDSAELTLRAQLLKDARRGTVRVLDAPAPGSREIITRVCCLGEAAPGLWAAELEPVTGRTHQLRAHMAHMGWPILGDDKYGNRAFNRSRGFSQRLCLWCEWMRFLPDGPMGSYAQVEFCGEAPRWLEK